MAAFKHEDPRALAMRMYWLAWQACGPAQGMGVLQQRDGVTEEDVLTRIIQGGHDNVRKPIEEAEANLSNLYADYLFGRMMKCSVCVWEGEVRFSDNENAVTSEYQDWASAYPTYQKLAEAAALDLMGDIGRFFSGYGDVVG